MTPATRKNEVVGLADLKELGFNRVDAGFPLKRVFMLEETLLSQPKIKIISFYSDDDASMHPRWKKCKECGKESPCQFYKTNITPERTSTPLCYECSDKILKYWKWSSHCITENYLKFKTWKDSDVKNYLDPLDIANLTHFESKRRKH